MEKHSLKTLPTLILGFAFAALDLWRDQRKFVANFLKTVGAVRVSPNRKACEASIREYAEEFVQVS